MRGVLVLGLLLALTGAGCVSSQSMRPKGLARPRLLTVPQGPDIVQLHVAVVERRLGDAYIDKALWASTDEQVAGIDRLALLENNGFRVGQVIGSLPGELQRMLENERYCANPKGLYLRAGSSTTLTLNMNLPSCAYRLKHDDLEESVTEEQAQCELLVEPTLTADGKTRLRFTPQVKYGEAMTTIEAAPDSSQWEIQVKKACHNYPEVSWEVMLAPNEWLVVGTHLGQPQSLGYQSFVNEEGATPIQRLLVLRTNRAAPQADSGGEVPTTAAQALKSGRR
jgi:hypothetical protein